MMFNLQDFIATHIVKRKPKYLVYILRALPNFFWPLKLIIQKKTLKKVGQNFKFGPNCLFLDHRLIEIGNNVFIGDYSIINTIVPVLIGDNVMFGPEVMLIAGDHNFSIVGKTIKESKEGGKNFKLL